MNDHIPDVTKMISDTPRTDAEEFYLHDSKYKVCDADFARTLERELNAANGENEEKRKDIVYLATEKAKLEERIKRLEEALDTLTCVIGLTPIKGNLAALQEAFDMARAVLKAKEAKL